MQSLHGKPEACFKVEVGTGLVFANDLTTSSFKHDRRADDVNLSREYFSHKKLQHISDFAISVGIISRRLIKLGAIKITEPLINKSLVHETERPHVIVVR